MHPDCKQCMNIVACVLILIYFIEEAARKLFRGCGNDILCTVMNCRIEYGLRHNDIWPRVDTFSLQLHTVMDVLLWFGRAVTDYLG